MLIIKYIQPTHILHYVYSLHRRITLCIFMHILYTDIHIYTCTIYNLYIY